MALAKGTNSYVTVGEADSYFADRLDASAWSAADSTLKSKALVTSAAILEDCKWVGTALDEAQDMAFPRSGYYFDPRLGTSMEIGNLVPDRITKANMELANYLLNNSGLTLQSGKILNIKVGDIELNNIVSPSLIPSTVKRIIRPLLENAGSSPWWRAN